MELKTGDIVKISCTWGDGPDVCVNIHHDSKKRKNWPEGFFPMDLTGDEAVLIGHRLIECGKQAKEMDRFAEQYFENEGKINE